VEALVSAQVYLTRRRLEELQAALSVRDRRIVSDVDRLGVLSGRQLRALHYPDSDAGRRLCRLDLARLVEHQVLVRLSRRVGGVRAGSEGFVYGLGVGGRRLVDPERSRWWARTTPGPAFLRHALALGDLYVRLREGEQLGHWALTTFDAEPICWRPFAGPGGGRLALKPDGYVVVDGGEFEDHFFVEIDCATESAPRILEKSRLYVRYWRSGREQARLGLFPLVLWVVPSERRLQQLVDALATLDAEVWELFCVVTADSVAEQMTPEAASNGGAA
jgi:Replication-relaxation